MSILLRLKIENLALIEEAEMELSEGLNVLTGETGAGKTMLAKALESLLGANTAKGIVRPGASAAYIEAVFESREGLRLNPELSEIITDAEGEIVLARRIAAEGRSRCMVNGRTVSLDNLRLLAAQLIAFFGQHEGRKLMLEKFQFGMLDRSGDGRGTRLHEAYSAARSQALADRHELERLCADNQAESREIELARFELAELAALGPEVGEEARLMEELTMLSSALEGREACVRACSALQEEGAAGVLLSGAAGDLQGLSGKAGILAERLEAARIEVEDVAAELEALASSWESDPQRQAEIEARLGEYQRLSRKHGLGADELVELQGRLEGQAKKHLLLPQLIEKAESKAEASLAAAKQAGEQLGEWRAKQAGPLSAGVTSLLGELAMPEADFRVALEPLGEDAISGLPAEGFERVVFILQANPGLKALPLSEVASGGEVSRLMLALISEAGLEGSEVLVLDEPDVGIG